MLFVADDLNITSTSVRHLLERRDGDALAAIARAAASAGCRALDLNLGYGGKQGADLARWLVRELAGRSDLDLVIDSANPGVIRAALAESVACGREKRPVINSFSLEPTKLEQVLPLAAEFDAEIIGYCASAGTPLRHEERMATAVDLVEAARRAGVPVERLYLDPILFPLTTAQDDLTRVLAFVRDLGLIFDLAPRTIFGLSNISYGLPEDRRGPLESAVLSMLAALGADAALVNPSRREVRNAIAVLDALEMRSVFSAAALEPPAGRTSSG